MLLRSVSSQQRFGVTDIKALGVSQLSVLDRPCYSCQVSNRPCYSSQTNHCYSSILFRKQQENPSSRCEGMSTQKTGREERPSARERDRPRALWLLFLSVFPSPQACLCKLGQPGVLFYLRASDLPLFCFCGLFPFLSFSDRHSGLFPILTS